jgi:hypothetical protein
MLKLSLESVLEHFSEPASASDDSDSDYWMTVRDW